MSSSFQTRISMANFISTGRQTRSPARDKPITETKPPDRFIKMASIIRTMTEDKTDLILDYS